jgi:hypothetical protein
MIETEIFGLIQENKKYNEDAQVKLNPDFAVKQHDIIELIDKYWVSKFRDGYTDSLGFLKPFYNVVNTPVDVAAKMIDIDTKNVRIISEDGASYYPAWFFEKEFKQWMKANNFAKLLNDIVYNLPKYGTVVVKKSKGNNLRIVPLQNLYNRPDVDNLEDGMIIEEHQEPRYKFKKNTWDKAKIKEALDKAKDEELITYYECYGDFSEVGDEENNYYIASEQGVILYSAKLDECPYRDVHWDKIQGRYLGRGVVEKLFEAQVQTNKVAHMKSQSLNWTSKRVFQSRDTGLTRNLMTDVQNGDIVKITSEIVPISNEERNLHAYQEEELRWDRLIDKLGFSYDMIAGGAVQASMPATSAAIQAQMASGFFELKQEDIGIFLQGIIYDWILPSFKKEKRGEHKLTIEAFDTDELEKVRQMSLNWDVNKAIGDYIKKAKRIPEPVEIEAIRAVVKEKKKTKKEIIIPDGFYEEIKSRVEVVITKENIDLAQKMVSAQTLLQIFGGNPSVLQDPVTRKIIIRISEYMGMPINEVSEREAGIEEVGAVQAQMGGSIAKAIPPSPVSTRINQRQTI